jgi:hypothetical protein
MKAHKSRKEADQYDYGEGDVYTSYSRFKGPMSGSPSMPL